MKLIGTTYKDSSPTSELKESYVYVTNTNPLVFREESLFVQNKYETCTSAVWAELGVYLL
jgi:hypothetical protein